MLVSAHLPESLVDAVSAGAMFGVQPVPGLSEVLAGRVDLAGAAQRAPRDPWLRVVTTGGTARAGGLLQSQALRDLLATLRGQAAYIVIEAPSTAASADAQSLAGLADGAIVAVEQRRTRHADVADAAAQLSRVGTAVLGAVVVPRLANLGSAPAGERPVPPDLPAVINRPSPTPSPPPAQPANGRNGHRPAADDTPTMIFSRIELADLPLEADAPVVAAPPRGPSATGLIAAITDEDADDAEDEDETEDGDDAGDAGDAGPPRGPSATGLIAAITEDGPVDGAR